MVALKGCGDVCVVKGETLGGEQPGSTPSPHQEEGEPPSPDSYFPSSC